MARAPSPETSPEVDFGAFLRPRSRNGVAPPNSRPFSSYASYASAPPPVKPSPSQQTLVAQPQGRMRQGAPRLGGLGLGGLQSSTFPSPPASHTPKNTQAPQSVKPKTATQPAVVGRPFLSPEMEKPTLRESTFALDRPVPDLGTSTTPPSDEIPNPDSPSPQPSPFLGLSPPTSPTLDRLGALAAPDEVAGGVLGGEEQEKGFNMMDEVLGLVEAELIGHEEQVGGIELSSEEETESEDEEGSSLADESDEEERNLVDPVLRASPHLAQIEPRSPSSRTSVVSVASVASVDSFHSLTAAQDVEVESSGSERSFDDPQTPPPLIPSALVAEAVVLIDEPTRSIDEVLLAGDSTSASKGGGPAPEMDRQLSTAFSDSSSSDVAPSSPRSSWSRGTSRSTSRNRAPPPPRPSRARRPPGRSTHTSPAPNQRAFEDGAEPSSVEEAAFEEQKEKTDRIVGSDTSEPPPRATVDLPSHSANSSLSMSSQPSDSFFFVPPPRQAPINLPEPSTALQQLSPVVAGYEGLGLRLPSSLRPKSFYGDPEATPMGSPTRCAASPSLFSSPPPLAVLPAAKEEGPFSDSSPVSTSLPSDPTAAPAPAAVLAIAPQVSFTHSSANPDTLPSATSSLSFTHQMTTASGTPDEDRSPPAPPAESDSGLAEIGVAAVGALVTGGMAVGYSAWRGLSAAASVGWSWKSAAPVMEQVMSVDEEGERPTLKLPGSLEQAEGLDDLEGHEESDKRETERAEVTSSVVSTEWGELDFPAPEGFIEAFKEAMSSLGPEEIAANEKSELDAQEAAHDLALQLHLETSEPTGSASTFATSPSLSPPFPGPPSINKRSSRISPGSKGAGDRNGSLVAEDDYDELMELVSPLFGTRVVDKPPGARYATSMDDSEGGRPLSRTMSGSTASSVSSRIPPSSSTSPSPANFKSAPPPSARKGSFFSFGKRRPSIDSSLAPRAVSSESTSSHRRAMSIDSGSSDSHDAAKLKRRSGLFSGSSIKSSATLSPPIPSSSPIESQIVDTTYVSYSSGKSSRRRNSTASTMSLSPSSSSPPPLPPLPTAFHKTSARRSSIRLESRYNSTALQVREEKKIYTVRFANADRGIGLRSVAEDEAQRAGGDAHAVKWVGVGRGNRYGNLLIQTDAETDEAYAEQVAEIKTKWRRFGGAQRGEQRDWARVKID